MMTDEQLYKLLNERTVREKIVIKNNVQKSLRRIFCDNLIYDHRCCHFCRSRDARVPPIQFSREYQGESLYEVVEDIEQNCPLQLSIIPNCVGGYDFKIEYKEE